MFFMTFHTLPLNYISFIFYQIRIILGSFYFPYNKTCILSFALLLLSLLVLVFIWIGVRLAFGVGPPNSDHLWWERILSALVKITLYALLIAYVVTGYVTASGLRNAELLFPINVAFARSDLGDLFMEAHFALKWVLLVVLGLHVLGTIKHSLIDRDNTLRNIWITKKG